AVVDLVPDDDERTVQGRHAVLARLLEEQRDTCFLEQPEVLDVVDVTVRVDVGPADRTEERETRHASTLADGIRRAVAVPAVGGSSARVRLDEKNQNPGAGRRGLLDLHRGFRV